MLIDDLNKLLTESSMIAVTDYNVQHEQDALLNNLIFTDYWLKPLIALANLNTEIFQGKFSYSKWFSSEFRKLLTNSKNLLI